MSTIYHMFKQCLSVLRFKDAHSSNYNVFQEESCAHQRVLFPKYGSLSWKNNIDPGKPAAEVSQE